MRPASVVSVFTHRIIPQTQRGYRFPKAVEPQPNVVGVELSNSIVAIPAFPIG